MDNTNLSKTLNFSSTVASFEYQLQGREVELVKGKEFWVSFVSISLNWTGIFLNWNRLKTLWTHIEHILHSFVIHDINQKYDHISLLYERSFPWSNRNTAICNIYGKMVMLVFNKYFKKIVSTCLSRRYLGELSPTGWNFPLMIKSFCLN